MRWSRARSWRKGQRWMPMRSQVRLKDAADMEHSTAALLSDMSNSFLTSSSVGASRAPCGGGGPRLWPLLEDEEDCGAGAGAAPRRCDADGPSVASASSGGVGSVLEAESGTGSLLDAIAPSTTTGAAVSVTPGMKRALTGRGGESHMAGPLWYPHAVWGGGSGGRGGGGVRYIHSNCGGGGYRQAAGPRDAAASNPGAAWGGRRGKDTGKALPGVG